MTTCHTLHRLIAAGLLAVGALASLSAAAQADPQAVRRAPLMVIRPVPDAKLPVRLDSLQVRAQMAGTVAKTVVEMVFHNPNDRILEGELQFPLLDGQTVSGFALDIDGTLRQAVPVPKARGRQVFDDVTRQRVDPALLQVTQGNNYSLRVYPIPARGSRRVQLEITQPLVRDRGVAGALVYRLPLNFAEKVGKLDVEVLVNGNPDTRNITGRFGALPLTTESDGAGNTVVRRSGTQVEGTGVLEVRRAAAVRPAFVSTEAFRGKTYFYAELPDDLRQGPGPRPVPRHLGIVWDASASAMRRDRARELALLDAYFKQIGSTQVSLQVVRNVAEPVETFTVRDGDWRALRDRIKGLVYDGGTSADLLDNLPAGVDAALAFTDGLFNMGDNRAKASVPVSTIASATSGDASALRRAAEASGGEAVDLLSTSAIDAVRQLTQRRARIVSLDGDGTTELLQAGHYAQDGSFRIAGVLTAPKGTVTVTLQDGQGQTRTHTLAVTAPAAKPKAIGLAAQQWAAMKVNALSGDELRNAAGIERVGMHFRLPTAKTSLIVLDAAQDYARYRIEPPESEPKLVADVERLVAQQRDTTERQKAEQLARVTREFEERATWWGRSFPKEDRTQQEQKKGMLEAADAASRQRSDGRLMRESAAPAMMAAPAPAPVMAAAPAPAGEAAGGAARKPLDKAAPAQATITLQKWAPDSPYARRMRAAQGADVYAIYLDERAGNENSTAFFLDAADILAEKKQTVLAERVVSNLAEMNLENRHILRILAYRLMQMKSHGLAVPVLERVLALSPDEPQSWRDLALAQAELGQHQKAVDNLWHVVTNPWHGRFPGIELIALTELNSIVARAPKGAVDMSAIPQALQKNLPVGMRTVLSWDADNTDIDLWVTDPNGEKAYYAHRLTYQGGLMSRDFTGGYGPEEFSLREPKAGKYKVQAQFYGHRQQIVAPSTTLMLQIYTDFGTAQQKSEQVIVRLSGAAQVVDVGSVEAR